MPKGQGTKGFTQPVASFAALAFCALFGSAQLRAQSVAEDLGAQVFFDAKQTGFTKDGAKQVLEGDVVAIGAGALIAADKILLDSKANIVEAQGHIIVLSRTQLFLGDAMVYHLGTGDFRLTNALMLSNDKAQIDEATRGLFGFTPQEVAFESARKQRLAEVLARKRRLATEARRQARQNPDGQPSPDLIDRYAVLLEQEKQITAQENPSLARLSPERREAFKTRRARWEASRKSAIKVESQGLETAYFRLEGEEITRVQGNDYEARNALFTPCFCEKDESPAWAFRADRVEAQVGGYADLHHPVLEIKGIPVLYLPYLKIPLKDRRQSGFLLPTIGYEKRSGNTFSQPVYFDLGADADATFTMDVYENRGTRLGLEYRIQQREYSGWDLKIEGIRDRLWMRDRALREDMKDLYKDGLAFAADGARDNRPSEAASAAQSEREYTRKALQDRGYWGLGADDLTDEQIDNIVAANEQSIDRYMLTPENTWRGAYGWRGMTFFAPRLSLVSNGEVTSDHRYTEELYIPDDYKDAFFGARDARAFSTAKVQMHLDGRDYYVGAGTYFGDNFQLEERFQGQQLPLHVKVLSRTDSILPRSSPVPLYANVMGEQYRITQYKARSQPTEDKATLGDGSWRRLKVDTVSPWVTDSIVQVNQFTELEARYIEHAALAEPRSEIRSWRAGIEFRLPIDGKGELPKFMQDAETGDGDDKTKYLHHIMDWRLRFSARPSVVKTGPYTTDPTNLSSDLGGEAYFSSDVGMVPGKADIDNGVPDEERMARHRRVTLLTDQVWKLFRRGWTTVQGQAPKAGGTAPAGVDADGESAQGPPPEDLQERARRELLMQTPSSNVSDLYDEANDRWLIDRYRLNDEYYEAPVSLHGDIAYDFLDAEQRPRDLERRRELAEEVAALEEQLGTDAPETKAARARYNSIYPAEPWKDLNVVLGVNYANWRFRASSAYGIYLRTARTLSLSLMPPRIFDTNISLGYTLEKKHTISGVPPVATRERSLGVATSLIPMVITDIRVSRRTQDGVADSYARNYKVATGATYNSPSKCWGLQVARIKEYDQEEANASYVLRLNVVFMGEQRGLPDMSPSLRRQAGQDPDQEGAGI